VENSAVSAGSEAVDHFEIMAMKAAANYHWRANEVDRPRSKDVEDAAMYPFPVKNILRPALGLDLPVSIFTPAHPSSTTAPRRLAHSPNAAEMSMHSVRSGNPSPEDYLEHDE
jgi:hypothetical protein